jgi:dihydroxyacetone kinase-like protein
MGLHGEPGIEIAKAMVEKMLAAILADLPFRRGDRVAVLIDDLGSMTAIKLCIANKTVCKMLVEAGIAILDVQIGKVSTTMDMRGFSISLIKLDEEL